MLNKTNTPTSSSRPALGKGLASLLPNAASSGAAAKNLVNEMSSLGKPPPTMSIPAVNNPMVSAVSAEEKSPLNRVHGITLVDVDLIIPNQFQPRRDFDQSTIAELAESIKANGIIQPLLVRKSPDGKLHLIAGERRLRASKLAGLKQVPVVLRASTDKEALELALIENIQREDLNCIDVALSYFQLMEDFKFTQEELAKRVGKDRSSIANHLRLLKLPEPMINDLRGGKITFGHGKALLAIPDVLQRDDFHKKILQFNWSVRETEKQIAQLLAGISGPKRGRPKLKEEDIAMHEQLAALNERLRRALGTKVNIKGDATRGTIQIDYFSRDDLERLSEKFLG